MSTASAPSTSGAPLPSRLRTAQRSRSTPKQWGGNPDAYVASQVTITKGDQAIVVDGISQNKLGDLEVTMSNDGRAIDRSTRTARPQRECERGGLALRSHCRVATQADLNATKPGELTARAARCRASTRSARRCPPSYSSGSWRAWPTVSAATPRDRTPFFPPDGSLIAAEAGQNRRGVDER
ncbi:hypothetical protein DdX_21853 [Ditylenchus destructor]|uniref:DUF1521 domain-containing protein n=1 Tax=Ditylenchus destructor TaxID=166010 RepID=A0AAD4MED0_9BILA|nr:hypothetical protein DdX_21853 [Ditylenchus destructor]